MGNHNRVVHDDHDGVRRIGISRGFSFLYLLIYWDTHAFWHSNIIRSSKYRDKWSDTLDWSLGTYQYRGIHALDYCICDDAIQV